MEKLTHQEEEAMLAIWKTGPGFIKEFLDNMSVPKPAYTTLASTVRNLEEKGFLSKEKFANAWRYTPKIKEKAYKEKFLSNVVSDYFQNSYKDLVSFFARDKKISAEELRDIIKTIEKS